jgi:ABC-type glycerol-3-phosphate transport system substrate-binding protein
MFTMVIALVASAAVLLAKPVEIEVSVGTDPIWTHEPLKGVVEMFTTKYPDIRVVFRTDSIGDKLPVLMASGTAPDVSILPWSIPIEEVGLDITNWIERDRHDLNRYIPGLVDAYSRGRDGRLYGLPYSIAPTLPHYNAQVLDEVGLEPPRKGWTYEDLINTYGPRLTRDTDGDGVMDRYAVYPGQGVPWDGINTIDGGQVILANGEVGIDRPEFISAVERLQALYYGHGYAPLGGDRVQGFWYGTVAMVIDSWSLINKTLTRSEGVPIQFGTTYLPKGRAPVTTMIYGRPIAVLKGTKNPEAAWKFIDFHNSREAQRHFGKYWEAVVTFDGVQAMMDAPHLPPGVDGKALLQPIVDTQARGYLAPFHLREYQASQGLANKAFASLFGSAGKGGDNTLSVATTLISAGQAMRSVIAQLGGK